MKTISAADANRHFSGVLRDVASGEVVTILSRGKAVATIGPAAADSGQREMARQDLVLRLRQITATGQRNWTRDELYQEQGD